MFRKLLAQTGSLLGTPSRIDQIEHNLGRIVKILRDERAARKQVSRQLISVKSRQKALENRIDRMACQLDFLTRLALEERYGWNFSLDGEELSIHSQHGEDGLVVAILHAAGIRQGTFLEIGCGDNGGNTGLLAENPYWTGLMIDRVEANTAAVTALFNTERVQILTHSVTPANLNELLNGREFNVVSIDIDSYDLEVAMALPFTPDLLIIEYNARLGPSSSWHYSFRDTSPACKNTGYYGAGLQAVVDWGVTRDLTLIHVERSGTNAFLASRDMLESMQTTLGSYSWGVPNFRSSLASRRDLSPQRMAQNDLA